MVDKVANRDGTVVMKNVEQFNFRDMVSVNVNAVNPFPVDDRVIISTSGPQEIQTWYLLGNDIDYQGGSIHITELSDAVGGTVGINGFGVVTFTPTAGYNGVMSFKYKMADAQNNPGATVGITGTTASAEMRATVYLNTANQPTDPLFNDQWYLSDANVIPVWNNYTGANVKVGIFDSGIFDPTHSDLAPNTDTQFAANYDSSQIKTHSTLVAGVVGADRNSQGGVGVAYGATLTGVAIADPEYHPDYAAMSLMKNYDVVNNSWGLLPPFSNTFLNNPSLASALSDAVNTGRNGLGTILVFAAGNDRGTGGDSNDSYVNSSRLGITVGAINKATDLSVLEVGNSPFSSPGASILISAPGSNIQSTSRLYQNSEGDSFGGTYEETRGTSFATPVVSGVVALMLEANPNLHYYDVQKILAYSARMVTDAATTWNYNTAIDWNGGGLHFSNDYGFGNVDALAAVRLAETWNTDPRNNAGTSVQSPLLNAAIPDGTSNLTSTINSPNPFQIVEYAEVQLNLNHTQLGDLVITLIAPNGTQSVLLNRNGKVPGSSDATDRGYGAVTSTNTLVLVSTHHFGETGGGNWQLRIEDKAGGQVGTLESWQLKLFGKLVNADDVYIYTNEFSTASGSRLTLTDASGNDTLNASAVSSNSVINLNAGSVSTIAGKSLTINSSTSIENTYTGDGNDNITGNALDNLLGGGRGNDSVAGGNGNDSIFGGLGADIIDGGTGTDAVYYSKSTAAVTVNLATNANTGGEAQGDNISNVENIYGSNYADLLTGNSDANTIFGAVGDDTVYGGAGNDVLYGGDGNDWLVGQAGADTLDGGNGNNSIANDDSNAAVTINLTTNVNTGGYAQGDSLINIQNASGSAFNDSLTGDANDNIFYGRDGNDSISSLAGNDTIYGGIGADNITAGDGNDWLAGEAGADTLDGGNGSDYAYYGASTAAVTVNLTTNVNTGGDAQGDSLLNIENVSGSNFSDTVTGDVNANIISAADGNDTLAGGAGADTLDGGNGVDTADYSSSSTAVTINLVTNVNTGGDAQGDSLANIENVTGSAFNDSVTGNAGTNTLASGAGNDTLNNGAGGNDTLTGGFGADTFVIQKAINSNTTITDFSTGTAGEVILLQGFTGAVDFASLAITQSGNNTIITLENGQTVTLQNVTASSLTAASLGGGSTITGTAGDDSLYGTVANDNIQALGGNDWIFSSLGADTIDGGNGTDGVSYAASTVAVTVNLLTNANTGGDAAGDVLTSVETIVGSAYNDSITGDANANTLYGANGNDTLNGSDGNDWLQGEAGTDAIDGGNGTDTVSYLDSTAAVTINLATNVNTGGSAQGDSITNTENVYGSSFNDTITGTTGVNTISGVDGNDTLIGGAGADTVSYSGSTVAVTINLLTNVNTGGDAQGDILTSVETIVGSSFNDSITGDTNANTLYGGNGNDTLNGGDGNDWLEGNAGTDTIDGGNGTDTISYLGSTAAITVNLATNINTGGTAQGDSISNVENIYASNFNDTITGTSGVNSIYGLDGNDTLIGGSGADTLDGGNGTDIVSYASSTLAVVINLATNVNTGGDAQGDSLLNIENVTGSGFNDLLNGNSGANTLSGGNGNDWLYGNAGADVMDGGSGTDGVGYSSSTAAVTVNLATNVNTGGDAQGDTLTNIETVIGSSFNDNITGSTGANTLYGANGNDTMNGGGGNDWIQGEVGVDTMTGGTGNDTFQYSTNSDSGIGAGSRDIITDFATGDIIRLTDFAGTFAFRSTSAFTGTANEVNYTQTGGNTIISVDSNGNGVADFQIEITGLRTMVQGDFAL